MELFQREALKVISLKDLFVERLDLAVLGVRNLVDFLVLGYVQHNLLAFLPCDCPQLSLEGVNFCFVVLLFNFLGCLLFSIQETCNPVGCVGHNDQDKKESQCQPGLPNLNNFVGNLLQSEVQPDVGPQRADGGDCEHSRIRHSLRGLVIYGNDGQRTDYQ